MTAQIKVQYAVHTHNDALRRHAMMAATLIGQDARVIQVLGPTFRYASDTFESAYIIEGSENRARDLGEILEARYERTVADGRRHV